jgi:hypothetical protein
LQFQNSGPTTVAKIAYKYDSGHKIGLFDVQYVTLTINTWIEVFVTISQVANTQHYMISMITDATTPGTLAYLYGTDQFKYISGS